MEKDRYRAEVAELGRKIRQAREQAGIAAGELAKRAEITPGFLNKVERGASCPSAVILARIAKLLGMDVTELLRHVLTLEDRFELKWASLSEEEKDRFKVWGHHPFRLDFETKRVLLNLIEQTFEHR